MHSDTIGTLNRPRVLVIDDEPWLADDLTILLEHHGFEALLVTNADDAKRLVQDKDFDCILFDCLMPPGTGMSFDETQGGRLTGAILCSHIKAINPHIIAVAFTCATDSSLHEELFIAGADAVISKCTPVEELAAELTRLCSRTP